MAWNEGGGGDKDPWGSRGDKGPPDLDEAFKKLQRQLAGIFGGGGGSSRAGKGFSAGMFSVALVLAGIVYVLFGIYQIDAQERGVVYRFGKVQETVVLPGLHWNPPIIDVVKKENVTLVKSWPHEALMLTEDENIVLVSLTVQYVISDAVMFQVNVRDPENSLRHATESALRHVVGSSSMDSVITDGRAQIALEVQERLQSYLDRYGTGILVSKVNIDKSAPPDQVLAAFDDVQRAKEDEQRYINDASAYAESIVPTARGEAQKQLEQANAYREQVIARSTGEARRFEKLLVEYNLAKEVTRDRLYIDAMESVLANSTKILIDIEGGNNLMYLPLDRLAQAGAIAASAGNRESISSIADAVMRELDNRAVSGRARDNR